MGGVASYLCPRPDTIDFVGGVGENDEPQNYFYATVEELIDDDIVEETLPKRARRKLPTGLPKRTSLRF